MTSERVAGGVAGNGAHRESRYELILNTAAELIYQRGYHAVTMRELAKAVGIKMPSVYHHFVSKEQILYALAHRTMVDLIANTNEELSKVDGGSVVERMAKAIRVGVRFHVLRQIEAGVVLSEVRNLSGEFAVEVRQLMRDYENIFRDLIVRGMGDGTFARNDPTMATYIVMSSLTRISVWYRRHGRLTVDDIEEQYSSLLVDMLRP